MRQSSVLYSRNPRAPAVDDLDNIHLYTARIPRPLLDFLKRPKAVLPAYDPIVVSWSVMPLEPLRTLRRRILDAIPDDGPEHNTHKETVGE